MDRIQFYLFIIQLRNLNSREQYSFCLKLPQMGKYLLQTQNMESPFCCPICFQKYTQSNKPLIILCGHSSCARCLTAYQKKQGNLYCPICRYLSGQTVDQLTTNFAIIQSEQHQIYSKLRSLQSKQRHLVELKKSLNSEFTNISRANENWRLKVEDLVAKIEEDFQLIKLQWRQNIQTAQLENQAVYQDASSNIEVLDHTQERLSINLKKALQAESDLSFEDKIALHQMQGSPNIKFLGFHVKNGENIIKALRELVSRVDVEVECNGNSRELKIQKQYKKWMKITKKGFQKMLGPHISRQINEGLENKEAMIEILNQKRQIVKRVYLKDMMICNVGRQGKEFKWKALATIQKRIK